MKEVSSERNGGGGGVVVELAAIFMVDEKIIRGCTFSAPSVRHGLYERCYAHSVTNELS